jgi:hypothetical protein
METGGSLPHSQEPATCRLFRNIIIFYGEELLAPRPKPKLVGHPLSAVRDCLFNVFAATFLNWRPFLHPQPEDAPCRGDRDPLNTVANILIHKKVPVFQIVCRLTHACNKSLIWYIQREQESLITEKKAVGNSIYHITKNIFYLLGQVT